jgi:hypothetical protein
VCIHQPDFAPYLGFFHRVLLSDMFIVLDNVQFLRKGSGWHNRDKIKTPNGERWLTLSVEKGHTDRKINEVLLSQNSGWIERNLSLVWENYRKAPYFEIYFPTVERIYLAGHRKMVDLNTAFLNMFFEVFGLGVPRLLSSQIHVPGRSTQRLINLVKAVEGTHYLSGTGARTYLDVKLFAGTDIEVVWQKFKHPIYPQLHGAFISGLSSLDVLFNCGPQSRAILRSCVE